MTDREIQLRSRLRSPASEVLHRYSGTLFSHGIENCVIVTGRTIQEQLKKFQEGKSGNKVGWHSVGLAWDEQLRRIGGTWDADCKDLEMYQIAARIAEAEGARQIGFLPDGSKRYIKTGKKLANGKPAMAWDPYHREVHGPYATLRDAVTAIEPDLLGYMD